MPDWTQPAREEVRRYFTRVRAALAESDADPDEVIGDLGRHIDEEIAAARLAVSWSGFTGRNPSCSTPPRNYASDSSAAAGIR